METNIHFQQQCEKCGNTPAYWRYFCNKVLCRACTIKALKIYIASLSAIGILAFIFMK
jgi:hypothetical protein